MTTVFLTAAETSGDMHAANLIRALAKRLPSASFVGVGGPQMRAAGCELLEDVVAHATMGLDALSKLAYFRGVIRRTARAMGQRRADVLVPVDSPAMNWHMAASARRLGVPVMYYIAPQVWAWARWRVKKLARLTDHVACLLPFEQEYLRGRGVAATFVGHPMFDHLPPRGNRPALPEGGAWRILLLPGSRAKEIQAHAGAMADAAGLIRRHFPKARFRMAVADERGAELARTAVGNAPVAVEVGQTYRLLGDSHFAIAASGTVTLEAAYLGVPMVICYRVSRVIYPIFRRLLACTRYLTLANILAGREVVPELIPWHGSADALAQASLKMLADPQSLEQTSRELTAITEPLREPLGKPASEAAADLVLSLVPRP